jgi:hypothetical protein
MLESEAQVGVVREGERNLGVLTLATIGRILRADDARDS